MWKCGRVITKSGYVWIRCVGHPKARPKGKYVPEHRLVMENKLGRYLERWEHVHHIDGDKQNNSIDNLCLISGSKHASIHQIGNRNTYGKHKDTSDRQCHNCGSKKTYMKKPHGENKTPYPIWHKLSDTTFICKACYAKVYSIRCKHRGAT